MAFDFKSWQSRQVPKIHAYQKGMDMLILFVSAVNSNNIHKQILFCISVFWQKSVFWEWCDLQRISFEWHWWTLIQIYSHQMVCWKGEFNFNLALTNLLNTLPVVIENNFWWLLFRNNTVQYEVYPVYFISFCYVVSGNVSSSSVYT